MTLTNLFALSLLTITLSFGTAACGGSELEGDALGDATTTTDATTPPDGDDVTVTTDPTDTTEPEDGDAATTTDSSEPDADVFVPPPEWETLTLGDVGAIEDVMAVTTTLAYASSGNRVLRWNGLTWLTYGEPNGDKAVHGVWADEDQVIAVGDEGFVARRMNGGEWETLDVGTTEHLFDIDGRAADDLWVVGDKGQVRRWDGTVWTEAYHLDTVNLRSVFVDRRTTGALGVYAVGNGGQMVANVDADDDDQPDGFKTTTIARSVTLTDILVLENDVIIAVGPDHVITAKRPTDPSFREQATNDERERDVAALALAPDGKLYAFGGDGLVLLQQGDVWTTIPASVASAGLKDFAAAMVLPSLSTRIMVLARDGGGIELEGSAWTPARTQPEAAVKDLEAAPDGTLWGAGSLGLLVKRGEHGWTSLVLPASIDDKSFEAVTIQPNGTVWAVGSGGAIVKATSSTAPEAVVSPLPLLALTGVTSNADGVVACGVGGILLELDDAGPNIRSSGVIADLNAVAYGGDGALWIAGDFGTLLRATGDALPVPVVSGVGANLNDVTATADGVIVVGDNGTVLEADAAGATKVNEETGVFLLGVDVRDSVRFAAGWNGVVLQDDGSEWANEVTGTNLILEAIWIGADEAIAAGWQGVLLRRLEAP